MDEKQKRVSPTKIIETAGAEKEHAYIQFPGRELIDVTLKSRELQGVLGKENYVYLNEDKIRQSREKYGRKYSDVHTHVYNIENTKNNEGSPLPSDVDLREFMRDKDSKTMFIAQQNKESNKVEGYFVVRKSSKKQPEEERKYNLGFLPSVKKYGSIGAGYWLLGKVGIKEKEVDLMDYKNKRGLAQSAKSRKIILPAFNEFAQKYGLKYRYVSAKDFSFDESSARFEKETLEGKVEAVVAITCLAISLIFLTSNITGNIIGSSTTSNILGVILLLVGIVGAFFWLKKK